MNCLVGDITNVQSFVLHDHKTKGFFTVNWTLVDVHKAGSESNVK